jgi:hypothetical protein
MTEPWGEPLVVIDTPRIGTATTLYDLLSGEPAYPGDVRYLDPLRMPWSAGLVPSLRERAVTLADTLGNPGSGPFTLVAHCTNTTLAFQLAAVLAERGSGPRCLVTFAPVFVNAEVVRSHVRELMITLGAGEETAAAVSSETWPDGLADPPASLARTVAALRRAAMTQAGEFGLEADEADTFAAQLIGQYELWLTHLASHIGGVAAEPGCPVLAVGSSAEEAACSARLIASGVDACGYEFARPNVFTAPELRGFFADLLHHVPASGGGRR